MEAEKGGIQLQAKGTRKIAGNAMAGWHHWLNGHEFEQTPGD